MTVFEIRASSDASPSDRDETANAVDTPHSVSGQVDADALFAQVVCGVDTTDESLEAARQAARLVSSSGQLTLVGVANLAAAGRIYMGAGAMIQSLAAEMETALERARAELGDGSAIETEALVGLPARDLLGEAERLGATLLAVGTHGRSRALGALLSSVASTAVHETPCSLLIARRASDAERFPSSIVCGVDGSEQAAAGAAIATAIAERFDASLRFVAADAGKNVDMELARRSADSHTFEIAAGKPVKTLVAASETADLIVIGSRGLHGSRAIRSVSERVAHEADCSVLIVR